MIGPRVGWLVMVALVGCAQSNTVTCDDGRVCPAERICDLANHLCVTPEQQTACAGIADGTDCQVDELGAGQCSAGVCVVAVCGDGLITGSERCDGEDLDDLSTCKDLGYYNDAALSCQDDCRYNESLCEGYCGDGVVNGPETCEPGVTLAAVSCLAFGYDRGVVGCTGTCLPDFSTCEMFGFEYINIGTDAVMGALWGSGNDVFVAGDAVSHWDGATWTSSNVLQGLNPASAFDAIWGSSPNDVWAVGEGYSLDNSDADNGLVSHYTNGSWTTTRLPSLQLHDVWGTGPSNVYAVGEDGTMLRYDGATWSPVSSGITETLISIWGSGPNDIYAGGITTLFHYDGTNWTPLDTAPAGFSAIEGRSATDVWTTTRDGVNGPVRMLHKTSGAFAQVVQYTQSLVWAISEVNPDRVFLAGQPSISVLDAGKLVHLIDTTLIDLWAASASDVWGVSRNTGTVRRFHGTAWLNDGYFGFAPRHTTGTSETNIYMSGGPLLGATKLAEWDGAQWIVRADLPGSGNGLWTAAKDDVFAVGDAGQIYRFNGTAWTTMTSTATHHLRAITGRSSSDAWAVGDAGTIVHFNGTAWSAPMTTSASAAFVAVWAAGATDVFAATSAGAIWHFDGTTWTAMNAPAIPRLYGLWGSSGSDVYASGFGEILHYDGATWTRIGFDAPRAFYGIGGSAANDVYLVGDGGSLYHYNGVRWVPMRSLTEAPLFSVYVLPHRLAIASEVGSLLLMKP